MARSTNFRESFGALRPVSCESLPKRLLPAAGPALYILGGDDGLLRERALARIARHHVGGGADPFRLRRLDGATVDVGDLGDATGAVSFTGGPVVLIRNGRRLSTPPATKESNRPAPPAAKPSGRRKKATGKAASSRAEVLWERFLALVKSPPGELVLAVEWEKNPDRRRRTEWLRLESVIRDAARNRRAVVVDCDPPDEKALPGWIRAEAGRGGVRLPNAAVMVLASRFGRDLRRQTAEIEKLASYVGAEAGGESSEIALEDVERVLGGGSARDIFALSNAVQRGDAAEALRLLDRLLVDGESPQALMALLYRQAGLMQLAREPRRDDGSLASVLGVRPGVAREIDRAASRFSRAGLRNILADLGMMDAWLKTTSVRERTVLSSVVFLLTHPPGPKKRLCTDRIIF